MIRSALFALALAGGAAPLSAQTAPASAPASVGVGTVRSSDTVVSADGRRIGRVDSARNGVVAVIYNGRFVSVPEATLTRDGRRLVSSLRFDQIVR